VLAADRRLKILESVADAQTIHAGELAQRFAVSEMTIRRDIQRLERDGFLRRTYGGATAHVTRAFDLAFNARALQHAREKRLIGMRAAHLLDDARLIFVGIGTTCEHLARYVPAQADMTIVTSSLPIASLLGTRPMRTVMLGGTVRRDELTCYGPVAAATLARYHFDVAVVGAAGLTARHGLTELNDDEAEINRAAIERSIRTIVLADGSKIGAVTGAAVAPISSLEILVTDPSAPPAELARLRTAGVVVEIATAGGVAESLVRGSQEMAGAAAIGKEM